MEHSFPGAVSAKLTPHQTPHSSQKKVPEVDSQYIQTLGVMEVTKFVVTGRDKAKLYGDYSTYRTSLSNRVHNLRKKLGVATKPRAKYTKKAPVTAEDIGSNHE
jgi:hypothetical protein